MTCVYLLSCSNIERGDGSTVIAVMLAQYRLRQIARVALAGWQNGFIEFWCSHDWPHISCEIQQHLPYKAFDNDEIMTDICVVIWYGYVRNHIAFMVQYGPLVVMHATWLAVDWHMLLAIKDGSRSRSDSSMTNSYHYTMEEHNSY